MHKVTTAADLKSAIQQLEIKQVSEWPLLREQFLNTYESLKPVNLIKDTISQLAKAPDFKGDLLNTTLSLIAGYLSKRVIVGATINPLKLLFGTLLQMGVTSIVSKNAVEIKSSAKHLINNIFSKRDTPA